MFCGLGEEERTKFRKKKKKKKQKKKGKKPHRGQNWVGWDKRVSLDIQPYEIFFPVPKPFLTETDFYAKLAERFSGSKPKSRDLLPRNFVQTYNLIISNCSQNFMKLDQTVLEF